MFVPLVRDEYGFLVPKKGHSFVDQVEQMRRTELEALVSGRPPKPNGVASVVLPTKPKQAA